MRRALILALALLLLPSIAQALPWGYPPSQGVTLSDPTATSASPKTFRGADQDSDAADEWYSLGVAIMMPGATPTQVSALAPFPVYMPAAFPGPVNLAQVGGAAYDLGFAPMLESMPVTIATDDTVMAAINALLLGIDAILFTIDTSTTSMDGHIPQLTLASQAPAASLSVVQDSTGAWTVVEASGAAIAGSVASLDGHVPQLTLAAQAPAASLSVVQDSTGAWTVVEASGATIAGHAATLAGAVAAGQMQVDVVAPLPAGTNSIGIVDTELAAPVAMGDAMGNPDDIADPSVPGVASHLLGWDNSGGVWNRLRTTSARLAIDFDLLQGVQVNVGSGAAGVGGTLRVITATDDPGNVLLGTIDADTSTLAGAVAGTEMQVDVLTLPALTGGSATIGAVDLQLDGTDVSAGAGAPDAGTVRTIEAQPDSATNSGLTVADQTATVAIAANAARANLLIQSAGTTTCLVSIEDATGGTLGVIVAGGTADDDGTGGLFTTSSVDAIYIYDLSGASTCKYRYIEETQ